MKISVIGTGYDPVAMNDSIPIFGNDPRLINAESSMAVLKDADALTIVTEWKEYRAPDFATIKTTLKDLAIFDGCNLYTPANIKAHRLEYYAISGGSVSV